MGIRLLALGVAPCVGCPDDRIHAADVGVRLLTPCVWLLAPGVRLLAPGVRLLAPCVRLLEPGVHLLLLGVHLLVLSIRASDSFYKASGCLRRAGFPAPSCVGCPDPCAVSKRLSKSLLLEPGVRLLALGVQLLTLGVQFLALCPAARRCSHLLKSRRRRRQGAFVFSRFAIISVPTV